MERFFPRTFWYLSILAVGGCAFAAPRKITRENGALQARKDLAAGKVQVLEAGSIGFYTPGVPKGDARLARLPRGSVPGGCTNPDAMKWVCYAEGYNAVVVAQIRKEGTR